MSNNIIKVGIPSKGRLRSGVLNIFKKNIPAVGAAINLEKI